MSIKIYYDKIKYRIHKTGEIKRFLEKVITNENKTTGDLLFILTSEESMLEINRKFLKHNYNTDVIAFNYSGEDTVSGEIYLGIETIRRNAVVYGSGIREEMVRVMIHGALHLCGYRDENGVERERMINRQEERLKEFIELKK